jgi:hypothetical protein
MNALPKGEGGKLYPSTNDRVLTPARFKLKNSARQNKKADPQIRLIVT